MAKEAMQHAQPLAAKSQKLEIRYGAAIATVRIEAAQKDAAHSAAGISARKDLATIIGQSQQLGYQLIDFDARLALAEFEMRAGQTAEGRTHLTAVDVDARAKGFNLVARKAVIARSYGLALNQGIAQAR